MGSTTMTRGEADVSTSPTTPCAPASAAGGGVAVLESVTSGGGAPLHRQPVAGVAVLASSTNDYAATLWSGDLVREGEAWEPRSR
jgi:hypothetical protein